MESWQSQLPAVAPSSILRGRARLYMPGPGGLHACERERQEHVLIYGPASRVLASGTCSRKGFGRVTPPTLEFRQRVKCISMKTRPLLGIAIWVVHGSQGCPAVGGMYVKEREKTVQPHCRCRCRHCPVLALSILMAVLMTGCAKPPPAFVLAGTGRVPRCGRSTGSASLVLAPIPPPAPHVECPLGLCVVEL